MQKVLRAATLAVAGLALGACSPYPTQAIWLTAADPVELGLEVAPPPRRAVSGDLSRKRGSVPRTVAHKQSPPEVPARTKAEPEATGSTETSSAPAAESLSDAEREERRRQSQLAYGKRMDELNRSASRAMRGICAGC